MRTRKIPSSATDEIFRSHTRRLIDSARKEILVITGEVGSFRFPDLRWAAERARRRGVSVKVYASKPAQSTVNGLLARGIEVYVGPAVRDHYIVVDSTSYIHSRPHPPILGKREGEVYLDQPGKANRIVSVFQELAGKAKRVERIDWKKDPLWKALQKPFDWRARTRASQLDEEFA
jgi:phosphatidylserine/phosphatidylglycerophosphate/cardiolipin synthase-like enzyme